MSDEGFVRLLGKLTTALIAAVLGAFAVAAALSGYEQPALLVSAVFGIALAGAGRQFSSVLGSLRLPPPVRVSRMRSPLGRSLAMTGAYMVSVAVAVALLIAGAYLLGAVETLPPWAAMALLAVCGTVLGTAIMAQDLLEDIEHR